MINIVDSSNFRVNIRADEVNSLDQAILDYVDILAKFDVF